MFINLSNHPSNMWGEEQRKAAQNWGDIHDLPFPQIDPAISEDALDHLVEKYFKKILEYRKKVFAAPFIVMVQGEFVFSFRLIIKLKGQGIKVVAAQSRRIVRESMDKSGNYIKESHFQFVGFREY